MPFGGYQGLFSCIVFLTAPCVRDGYEE